MSQTDYTLQIIPVDQPELPIKVKLKNKYKDSLSVEKTMWDVYQKLLFKGYIEASVDSLISKKGNAYDAYLYIGNQYEEMVVRNGNINPEFLENSGLKNKDESMSTSFFGLQNIKEQILSNYKNNGYPFAEVWLDSLSFVGPGRIEGKIYANQYEQILIDSIYVHGDVNMKIKYIENYLSIESGDVYSHERIDKISKRIAQLPFVTESKPPQIIFLHGKAQVHVFLAKQKMNQFNFLLGFLPDATSSDKKLTITGDGKLHLFNSFGVGEEIYADFSQLKPRTQQLEMRFTYPYFIHLPIGISGDFSLYKNDTLFVDIGGRIGLYYLFSGWNYFKAFFENQTSNALTIDTNEVKSTGALPDVLDARTNAYGIELNIQQLDYVLNPRKGFVLNTMASVGQKKIKKNPSITTLTTNSGESLEQLYDNINIRTLQYNISLRWQLYRPIRKRSTMLFALRAASVIGKDILSNEMFRIGGNAVLRGFDEEAIFTPYYTVSTVEYRFLLSKNSYYHMFFDWGIVEDSRFGSGHLDFPFGFGTGVALETKGGIFSLSYALGKQFENPLNLRNGKIHFGYVNVF